MQLVTSSIFLWIELRRTVRWRNPRVSAFERFAKSRDSRPIVVLNVNMAKTTSSAHTAPKGHATRAQGSTEGRSFFGPALQWVVVILAGLAIIGAIMFLGRDVRSSVASGGGGHGPSVEVVVDLNTDHLVA
ncbi:MAG: hypothetical protein ACJAXA_001245 [Candidatus Aldehydirespiratoraceae bacterium]|jgi:hypothetical protein